MFTMTKLYGGGYLVRGTDVLGDSGETVLHSESYNKLQEFYAEVEATAKYTEAVDKFFAPLLDAAAAVSTTDREDPEGWGTVVLSEHVHHEEGLTVHLDTAGVILRLIEQTDGHNLRWVKGELVVVLED